MPPPFSPRVTVVVPLYQEGRRVRRTLESVFAQTLKDFEVIVVDDGSTDDAIRVLNEMADSRLFVHRQEHQGVSVARNRGVSLARAPWVAFLDADDEWLPAFLESTLRIAVSFPGLSAVFSNLRDHKLGRPMLAAVRRSSGLVLDYFATLVENDGVGISSSSALVSKTYFTTCGGFIEGVEHGEDIDLWARLAWSGDIGFCEEPLAVYHSEVPDSASKNILRATRPYPAVLRSYEEWSEAGRIPERLRDSSRQYANWILARNAMELAHQGLRQEARQRLNSARWLDAASPQVWRARAWTWLPTSVLRVGRLWRNGLGRDGTDD